MSFGLTNARATFNPMMDWIFREHQKFVGIFFDDIIVHPKDRKEDNAHLAIVFAELRKHKLMINGKRVSFSWKRFIS